MSETIKAILTADSSELHDELEKAAAGVRALESKFRGSKLELAGSQAWGPLSGELQLAEGAMAKFRSEAMETKSALESLGPLAGKFGAMAAAGLAVAGAGVVAAAKSAIDAGGELADAMARTGADGSNLVILGKAFENAGVSAQKVPDALNKLQKSLAGVNDEGEATNGTFAKLGLSVSSLSSQDPVMAFNELSKAIAALPDPAERAAVAMKLFGRGGGELLAVMTDQAAWQTAASQVGVLADALEKNAAKFDSLGDRLSAAQIAIKGIGVEAASFAAPALEWLADSLEALNGLGKPDFKNLLDLQSPFAINGRARVEAGKTLKAEQAADPGFMRSAKEDAANAAAIAERAAADAAAAEQAKAIEQAKAAEAALAEARAQAIKTNASRFLAAQDEVFKLRLTAEENLQRQIAELDLKGPRPTAASINAEQDPTKAADEAERLAKTLTLESQLKELREKSAAADASKAEAAAREQASRAAAVQAFNQELQIQQALARGEFDKAEALEKQRALAEQIKDTASKTGWDPSSAAALATALANAKDSADKLKGLMGTTKDQGDARREKRSEDRQLDRDLANAKLRAERADARADRQATQEARGKVGGLEELERNNFKKERENKAAQDAAKEAQKNKEAASAAKELQNSVKAIERYLQKVTSA